MPKYREFYVRGAGRELTVDSSRDHPRLILGDPLQIKRFNVKTVEIPLSFSQQVHPREYAFTTTYTMNTAGHSISFIDYVVFTDQEIVTGALIVSKMQTLLIAHAARTVTQHTALTQGFTTTLVGGAAQLNGAPTMVLSADGIPQLTFVQALAIVAAPDTTVNSVVINFGFQSKLADLFDYPYYLAATITVDDVVGATIVSVNTENRSMVTRPAYLFLHSNLRAGLRQMSTQRPDDSINNTIIAKIDITMDNTQAWGLVSVVWVNPCQHPDLFYTANDREYSEIDFWMSYPDGTPARFSGNSFSLTLACLVDE